MKTLKAADFAFKINTLSLAARVQFYRDAVRKAHAERTSVIGRSFRKVAFRFHDCQPLTRAFVSTVFILAAIASFGVIVSGPAFARMGSALMTHVSAGSMHGNPRAAGERFDVKPAVAPGQQAKTAVACNTLDAAIDPRMHCASW